MITAAVRLDHPILARSVSDSPSVQVEWVPNAKHEDCKRMVFWALGIDEYGSFEEGLSAGPTVELRGPTEADQRRL